MSESQVDDYTQVQAYRNEPFKICTKRDNLPNDGSLVCVKGHRSRVCETHARRTGSPRTYCRAPKSGSVDETAEPETTGTFDDYLRADSFDSLRGAFFCKTATR